MVRHKEAFEFRNATGRKNATGIIDEVKMNPSLYLIDIPLSGLTATAVDDFIKELS